MNCVSPGLGPFLGFCFLSWLFTSSASSKATSDIYGDGVGGGLTALRSSLCPPLVCSCSDESKHANCSHRGFTSIPPGLSSQIYYLDLSFNDIETINGTDILKLNNLKALDLSFNRLSELILDDLHYQLTKIDLSSNNISSVRSLKLEGLLHLTEINLSNNKLTSLTPSSFATSGMLRSLNLKGNKIVSLEPGCLNNLSSLEELLLSKNKLSSLPKGLFDKMKYLQVLDLSKNKFVEIQGLTFLGLESLKVLRLRRNSIEYLLDGAFYGLHNIEELSLDRNKINYIGKGWLYGLDRLNYLYLSNNNIDYINRDAWDCCKELVELDLRSNGLLLLDKSILEKLTSLKILLLQENKISHVEDDAFIEVSNLEKLALDGNQISHTIEDMASPFKHLSKLQTLTLSRNAIKSVGNQAFVGNNMLQEIDLSDNAISTIQENAFVHLSQLHTIKLNSGSMLCDCHLKWFPNWLNNTKVQGGHGRCAHPETLKGQTITQISYESYTCDDFPKPYLLQQPETKITLHGQDLVLTCRAASTSSVEMSFVWKLESRVLEGLSNASTCTSRCHFVKSHSLDGKGKEVTSELILSNLTYEDAGQYQCIVSNEYGTTYSERANITVYVYPKFIVYPDEVKVKSGESATMKCAAQGVPAPKVSWSKDEGGEFPAASERRINYNSIPSTQDRRTIVNSFIIRHVKSVDMGTYTCTASNPAGKISWNITLSVLEPPKFVKAMEDRRCVVHETAVIECQVSGSPKPKLTWYKDNQKLEPTERHFFAADNQLLILVNAKMSDSGVYQCTVHNQLGTVTQTGNLLVEQFASQKSFGNHGSEGHVDYERNVTNAVIIVFCCVLGLALLLCTLFICYKLLDRRNNRSFRSANDTSANLFHPSLTRRKSSDPFIIQPMIAQNPQCRSPDTEADIGDHLHHPPPPSVTIKTLISGSKLSVKMDTSIPTPQSDQSLAGNQWDSASERDSGTGDSKKSSENVTESYYGTLEIPTVAKCVEISDGCGESRLSLSEFDGTAMTRIEDTDINGMDYEDEEDIYRSVVATDSGCGEALIGTGPGSFASGSLRRHIGQSITDASSNSDLSGLSSRANNLHKTLDKDADLSSSTYSRQTSAPGGRMGSISKCGSPVPSQSRELKSPTPQSFLTFRPHLVSNSNLDESDSDLGLSLLNGSSRKRASTVELNGECYLAIEAADALAASAAQLDPAEYRGGAGLAPSRRGLELQQRLLEESLNSTDYIIQDDSRLSMRRHSRGRSSMLNLSSRAYYNNPRGTHVSTGAYHNSLPRRVKNSKYKKLKAQMSQVDPDRTDVGHKPSDLFT